MFQGLLKDVPGAFRAFQECSKESQRVSEGSNTFRRASEAFRRVPGAVEGIAGCFRRFKDVIFYGSQGFPGACHVFFLAIAGASIQRKLFRKPPEIP